MKIEMDSGRRGKIMVTWEKTGREASLSRGQKPSHVNSGHAPSDFKARHSKSFSDDPGNSSCCDFRSHQLTGLKIRLEERTHPERTQNWGKT